ncbi:UDP-glycosyltransferase 89B2-like [Panicum miliaceum]|uniref:UDP-glycosyltransferase 89B2-like n=1 Tax=Panicum miliaceum TaxID=4540 RepID=A0A3L6S4Z8_PANMI|nr:UDP-glycosyltransferase 89B2-like [Panicum miliaceum]
MAVVAPAQAASGSTTGAPHVLVVPYPAQGHMQPLLHLASLLAARGLRLTVVATPATVRLLAPLLAAHPSSVRPLTFPSAADHDTSGPTSVGADFHAHAAALRGPLREWLRSRARSDSGDGETGRVVAVISDFFCGWTQPLAAEVGVPRLVFAPSGVLATAATHSLFRRMPRPPEGDRGRGYAVSFPALRGAPAFPWRQISRMYRAYVEGGGDEHSEAIKDNYLWNLESAAFVCNTCHPIEGKYLDAQPLEDLAGKRVWAVGPVAPPPDSTGEDDPASNVTAWLDAFPDSSVAYVSFGTMIVPPPPHAAALASALERSGTPFVWAAATTTLPDGFEDRAAASGTGLVLRGWAPQVAALRHRAVGCFVTHCGWNSRRRVPMLAWPMAADQFFNARLVVEEARAAVAASWGGFGGVPDAEDLARALTEVVGEAGAGMSARSKELALLVEKAVGEGGSSRRELDGLLEELRQLGSLG